MKKILFIMFVILGFSGLTHAIENTGGKMNLTVRENGACSMTAAEREGILKAIGAYIQAAQDGSETAKKGFAPLATMSWNEAGSLKTVPIKALYDYFDEKKRPASGEIVACSVAGDVAMVRLESDFDGALFTDMFTLVKDGDDWKIVSKVYHVKN